jgi:peptide/nickel transport system permease protein
MIAYLGKRLAQGVVVVLAVLTLTFVLLRVAPGDPVNILLPQGASEEAKAALREQLGTDKTIFVQFGLYLAGVLRGDLGQSTMTGDPVRVVVLDALPATVALAGAAMLIAVSLAFPLGILAAYRSGSSMDRAALMFALAAQSAPNFWVGVILVLVFAIQLGWFPAVYAGGPASLFLPALALSTGLLATLVRTVRQSMLETLSAEYVRAARARGLPEHKVVLLHALKNAAIPLVTVLGIQTGVILGGAVAVELVFDWPGIGSLASQAMNNRDYPVLQGIVIMVAVTFVLVNLLVDISYAYLNPRVRIGAER